MDYFNDIFTSFLGIECGSSLAVYAVSKVISYFLLNEGLMGLELDFNFNFWVNYPFKVYLIKKIIKIQDIFH